MGGTGQGQAWYSGLSADAALDRARRQEWGEVPVGAVVVRDGEIVAAAGNRTRELCDPTAHAEVGDP